MSISPREPTASSMSAQALKPLPCDSAARVHERQLMSMSVSSCPCPSSIHLPIMHLPLVWGGSSHRKGVICPYSVCGPWAVHVYVSTLLSLHTSVPLCCLPTSIPFLCVFTLYLGPHSLDPSMCTSLRTPAPPPVPGDSVCTDYLEAGGWIHTSAHNASQGLWGELSNALSQNSTRSHGRKHNATSTKCSRKAETCQR